MLGNRGNSGYDPETGLFCYILQFRQGVFICAVTINTHEYCAGTVSVYCGNTFCRRFRYAFPIGGNSDYGNIILRKRNIVEIRCAVCKINILNLC